MVNFPGLPATSPCLRVWSTPDLSTIEFDDQVRIDLEWNLVCIRCAGDRCLQFRWIHVNPVGDDMSGEGLHVLTNQLVDAFLERDHVTRLDGDGWAIGLLAVDQHVAVRNDLSSGPDRPAESGAANDVVESRLQQLEQHFTRVAFPTARLVDVATELLLENVVVVAELLFLRETNAIVLGTTTSIAMHAGGVQLATRRMLREYPRSGHRLFETASVSVRDNAPFGDS